jgi:hypothetical protein
VAYPGSLGQLAERQGGEGGVLGGLSSDAGRDRCAEPVRPIRQLPWPAGGAHSYLDHHRAAGSQGGGSLYSTRWAAG